MSEPIEDQLPPPPPNLEIIQLALVDDLGVQGTDLQVTTPGEDRPIRTGRCLYSCDFAPCTPFIVFRSAPDRTWFRHCSSPFAEGYIEEPLQDPTSQAVMVVGRPELGRFAQKRALAMTNFVKSARAHPNLRFIWVQIDTNETMHVRVDGATRTIAVSTNRPPDQ